jgi:prepilin-type N-terminal cleavage/methylation domain-containing protein
VNGATKQRKIGNMPFAVPGLPASRRPGCGKTEPVVSANPCRRDAQCRFSPGGAPDSSRGRALFASPRKEPKQKGALKGRWKSAEASPNILFHRPFRAPLTPFPAPGSLRTPGATVRRASGADRRPTRKMYGIRRKVSGPGSQSGFTLLEVLVSLVVLAIGAVLALSLISGSLGNIRKVQLRTRTVEHAESVMELALLDDAITRPTTFSGDFEDGTRWSVRVDDYVLPDSGRQQSRDLQQNLPMKLLSYTVLMFSPDSPGPDYKLQTLKLVKISPEDQQMRMPQ